MDIQIEIQYFSKYISKYSTHSTLVDASACIGGDRHTAGAARAAP